MVRTVSREKFLAISATAGALACLAALAALVLWPGASTAGGIHSDYSVSVSRSGTGQGVVTSTPAGITCGTDCDGSFSLGTMVELTADPAKGSRFAGWTGACTGTGNCSIPTPSDGLPVSVDAEFEKAPRPTVSFIGKATPKLARVRLGCGEAGPCDLQVTVLLSFWLSKKGYDYYKAASDRVSLKGDGIVHRDLALRTGQVGERALRALKLTPGTKVTVRVAVRNVVTGTQMAINQRGFCGKHPCGTNIIDKK
jgi:hypothetical protein